MGPCLGRIAASAITNSHREHRGLRVLGLCALCALCGSVVRAAGDQPREVLHYVRTYNGRVIGVWTVEVFDEERDGRPVVRSVFSERERFVTQGTTKYMRTERVEITDADGYGIELLEVTKESGQVVETRISVTDDAVIFRTVDAGHPKAFRSRRDGPVRFDLDGRALARKGVLAPGGKVRDLVAARGELGIAELEAEVIERVELPVVPGVYAAGSRGYRIRIANSSGAGEPWEIIADGEGRTVELRIGPQVIRRSRPEDARLPSRPPVLKNTFATRRLRGLERVRSMRVEVTVAEGVREDVFPGSFYGSARRVGDRKYILRLTEARPDGRLPREELSEEDRARFLSPTRLAQSDAPRIIAVAWEAVGGDRAALRAALASLKRIEKGETPPEEAERLLPIRIVGGEKEPLKKALFLARRVRRSLRSGNRGPSVASALEALRARFGNCTEHAVLFTALARAAGLPARRAMGLVHDGRGFQYHAWAEVHVEDRWVPVDPTLGRMGVPGVYILLGREGDLVEYHSRANALQGRTEMRVLAVDGKAVN